jgi:hypothetical protein
MAAVLRDRLRFRTVCVCCAGCCDRCHRFLQPGALGVGCEHHAVIPRLGGVLVSVVLPGNGHGRDLRQKETSAWLACCVFREAAARSAASC